MAERKGVLIVKNKLLFCILLLFILFAFGCGNRKSPSGGPIDEINPTILSVSPAQYQEIENKEIIVNFSKLMDQKSANAGITIYPPILNKTMSWKRNILTIKIKDELKENTNYLISFNSNLKCYHGNPLDKPETYIFSKGKLSNYAIRGSFTFEQDDDKNLSKTILLLDKDSLLVLERQFQDNSFVIDYLNSGEMTVRAFIDKNNNKRYDYGQEPYYQQYLPENYKSAININFAYQDTTKPNIKQVKALSKNDITIIFNKELVRSPYVAFVNEENSTSLTIKSSYMDNNSMHYITSDQDTIKYKIVINNLYDKKNNYNDDIIAYFNGTDKLLTVAPKVVKSSIRNGSAIDDQMPIISVEFSDVLLKGNVFASMTEIETGKEIKLSIKQDNSKLWKFQPTDKLKLFNSYSFTIKKETKNHHDLTLKENFNVQFMVKDKKK
ncbi:MAG TPA: Ig-like domain-containing protein [Candidatus Cloacimonadota bacterium]|nr:Ig-like domain-containing protein [Candidatus Cloacimonadota bacterium]